MLLASSTYWLRNKRVGYAGAYTKIIHLIIHHYSRAGPLYFGPKRYCLAVVIDGDPITILCLPPRQYGSLCLHKKNLSLDILAGVALLSLRFDLLIVMYALNFGCMLRVLV